MVAEVVDFGEGKELVDLLAEALGLHLLELVFGHLFYFCQLFFSDAVLVDEDCPREPLSVCLGAAAGAAEERAETRLAGHVEADRHDLGDLVLGREQVGQGRWN